MKLKLYMETSIWNFAFATDSPEKMEITLKFFDELKVGKYEGYISPLVLAEIADADEDKQDKLLNLIKKHNPVELEETDEILNLADKYMARKIVPFQYKRDLTHVAYAVVNHMNVLLSWNLEHLVKLRTKIEVNSINRLEGYHEIDICTPEEVIGYVS